MFFDNFWILERGIFEGETVRLTGDIGTVQLYEVIMEGNKLDRLRFLLRDFGIFVEGFFGLGDFWREGEKFFFSTKN